jgi:hypothetical protein
MTKHEVIAEEKSKNRVPVFELLCPFYNSAKAFGDRNAMRGSF